MGQAEIIEKKEISLLFIAKLLWVNWKTILKVSIGVFLLGVAVALIYEDKFTTETSFISTSSDESGVGGNFSSLAALTGVSLSGLDAEPGIPPTLYPDIVESPPFKQKMLNAPIHLAGKGLHTSYQGYYDSLYKPSVLYYVRRYTIGLPGQIKRLLIKEEESEGVAREDGLLQYGREELDHFERIQSQLQVEPDDKKGIVTLSFTMDNAELSAQMGAYAKATLQNELIEYKIKRAQEELEFTNMLFSEKKSEFELAQQRLSDFQDQNIILSTENSKKELRRLQAEYDVSFKVYNDLALQLEQAKLKVNRDTPIFSDIKPIVVPLDPSSPSTILILVVFVILGGGAGVAYVLFRFFFKEVKSKWKAQEVSIGVK